MKIAVITEDGVTISQHFGRAPYYKVFTIEGGKIVSHERRDKMSHSHFSNESQHEEMHLGHPQGHGFDPASQTRHSHMLEAISDCKVLLAGGMGNDAYESLKAANIKPIITDISIIDEAVSAYMYGKIIDHTERLH